MKMNTAKIFETLVQEEVREQQRILGTKSCKKEMEFLKPKRFFSKILQFLMNFKLTLAIFGRIQKKFLKKGVCQTKTFVLENRDQQKKSLDVRNAP